MAIRDTRMMAKALEQRWLIKPEYRDAIVRRLVAVVANPASSPREVTAASRALIAAEAQNQQDEHKELDEFASRVIEAAHRLGIDTSSVGTSQPPAIGAAGGDGYADNADSVDGSRPRSDS